MPISVAIFVVWLIASLLLGLLVGPAIVGPRLIDRRRRGRRMARLQRIDGAGLGRHSADARLAAPEIATGSAQPLPGPKSVPGQEAA